MVQQYDAYSPIAGYHVNGALTLGENVADNAGLAMAVRAYRLRSTARWRRPSRLYRRAAAVYRLRARSGR